MGEYEDSKKIQEETVAKRLAEERKKRTGKHADPDSIANILLTAKVRSDTTLPRNPKGSGQSQGRS